MQDKEITLLITKLLEKILERNLKIVCVSPYSTSGHNNQSLVSKAIALAGAKLNELVEEVTTDNITHSLLVYLNYHKDRFDYDHNDCDGAGVGTLVDVIKGLEKLP